MGLTNSLPRLSKLDVEAILRNLHNLTPKQIDLFYEAAQETLRQEALDKVANVAKGLTVDLADFFRAAWVILEPELPLVWSWHYEYLCEWLTMIGNGEFKKQFPDKLGIIINVPPRTAKSTLCTVAFPVWTWLEHPQRRFLCASYSGDLAIDHAGKRRYLVKSAFFQKHFADRFRYTTDQTSDFRNDRTGYFIATSISGAGTGFGGDICIGDDLLSAQEARSKAVKKATNDWLDSTFRKRLNSQTTGCFVHISQRLAADDPTGHLLGTENPSEQDASLANEWIHIKIPREAERNEEYIFPITKRVYPRLKGDILQPARNPPRVIESLKAKSREWAGQEQQEPAPLGGIVFDPNWWIYYERGKSLPVFDQVVLSVDAAFKSAQDNDYVAIHKYGIIGRFRVLLNRRTEHTAEAGRDHQQVSGKGSKSALPARFGHSHRPATTEEGHGEWQECSYGRRSGSQYTCTPSALALGRKCGGSANRLCCVSRVALSALAHVRCDTDSFDCRAAVCECKQRPRNGLPR